MRHIWIDRQTKQFWGGIVIRMENTTDKRKNIVYLEFLRIIAIWGVLFNHTNTRGFYLFAATENKVDYGISIVLSVLCKMAVPLFFMISGYLLLGKKESFREVAQKRIFRYALVIAAAATAAYMADCLCRGASFSIRELIKIIYRGDFGTYWFLYTYLGLMLMLPFLRGMAGVLSARTAYYLVGLKMVLGGLMPVALFLVLGYSMSPALQVTMLEDSVFYFLAGFYFGTDCGVYRNRKVRITCRILSGICVVATCFMLYYEHKVTGVYTERFLGLLLPIVCITVFCEAGRCAENRKHSERLQKIILFAGDKTLGIYLLEPIFRMCIGEKWNRLTEGFPPLPSSLLWCLLIFGMGILVTWVLKLLPFVRKLI